MKRFFLLFLCLFLAGIGICSAYAQEETGTAVNPYDVSDEMIGILTSNLDNLFPLNSLRNNFMTPAEAVYSNVGQETLVRKKTGAGKRNILLVANADGRREYTAFDAIDKAYPSDFMLTMDVTVEDSFPEHQSGCFVGFTDYGISAFSGNDGALMIGLLIDGLSAEFYVKAPDAALGFHIPLGEMARKNSKLSIIHLTGHTYAYINGKYLGQFHDGKNHGFRLIYGAAVFTEGDTAECSFDNLLVRKVSIQ